MRINIGLLLVSAASAQQTAWGQCGGKDFSGPKTCVSGYTCQVINDFYYQCTPSTATTTSSSAQPSQTNGNGSPSQRTKYGGVNLAGFDFGMATTGTQDQSQILAPDNAQMSHFANDDGHNLFRLPFGWQFLVDSPGQTLKSGNLAQYDSLVQACLGTGAYCILDCHNYARWNGAIVGQGGPTNAQLANLWQQLASKYAGQSRVIFGIMNEPHDVPNVNTWATTVQASVTAIRQAGATSQMILLPGNGWSSASELVSSGSFDALSKVQNPDGSTTNLIFDVHKYLDSDNSGTHAECVTNNIDSAFKPLATALRQANRQAMLTETGGGNTQSCVKYVCEQLDYVNQNSDVFLGYTGWSAGAFQPSWNYVLTLVPSRNGNGWSDTLLGSSCFKRT